MIREDNAIFLIMLGRVYAGPNAKKKLPSFLGEILVKTSPRKSTNEKVKQTVPYGSLAISPDCPDKKCIEQNYLDIKSTMS